MKKAMMSLTLTAIVASAIGLSARQATSSAVAPAPPSVATFLVDAAADNQAAIDLAKIAEGRAMNADVKSMAGTIDQDHSSVAIEIASLARAQRVTLSAMVPVATAVAEDHLKKLNGAAFDRAYVNSVVANHQRDIADFERESTTTNPDVKMLIAKLLPAMRAHLMRAERLQTQLGKQPVEIDVRMPSRS